jgi:maltose 6'-phosphate phosphatase
VIELLYASNLISRRLGVPQQRLTFVLLVENHAYAKQVAVHWRGEDGEWRDAPAGYIAPAGDGREIWRADVEVALTEKRSLPGNVQFVLYASQQGREYWENNGGRNYALEADCGVLLGERHPVAYLNFSPHLNPDQHILPVAVAVRGRATEVTIEWSTDGWKSKRRTKCILSRRYWDRQEQSNARNPNQYGVGVWTARLRVQEAFRIECAIRAVIDGKEQWDNDLGFNYVARRGTLKVMILNLHCYQEENQMAKLATVAQAIRELKIDVVCLQEVGEHWNDGAGDWASNTARIIHEQLPKPYYIAFDWSHQGFERYREGVAILSRYPFMRTEARYVSESRDVYDIHSRKALMGQIHAPGFGLLNIFSVHLSWWEQGFRSQFDALCEWAEQRHTPHVTATLLCGDFNVRVGSVGYTYIVEQSDFEDQFLKVTDRNAYDAIFLHPWNGGRRHMEEDDRIDFILMKRSSRLRPVAAQRLFTGNSFARVSDHEGFLVEFEPV